MDWKKAINEFKIYLSIERNLSDNTVNAYIQDIFKFSDFFKKKPPLKINRKDLLLFVDFLAKKKLSSRSRARKLSSIKSFYNYLIFDNQLEVNPCENIHSPKLEKKLPIVLSLDEVDTIINCIDLRCFCLCMLCICCILCMCIYFFYIYIYIYIIYA